MNSQGFFWVMVQVSLETCCIECRIVGTGKAKFLDILGKDKKIK